MENQVDGGRVMRRWVRAGGLVLTAGFVALGTAGTAVADPLDSCSPAVMMRAQADQVGALAAFLAAHPNAGNSDSPQDAAAALQMVATMRNIQANMAESCGLTMDQLAPGATPGG